MLYYRQGSVIIKKLISIGVPHYCIQVFKRSSLFKVDSDGIKRFCAGDL